MTGEQVYVSHAPADLELVQKLFTTVRNFPFDVHVALEEVDSNENRDRLEGRIVDSDVVVAVLTDRSANSRWVNQEIGYARAEGVPVLPVYEDEAYRGGFLADVEGVAIDRDHLARTVFELLTGIRAELTPLGPLSVPNWFMRFPCTVDGCREAVVLEIESAQQKLWKQHRHGHPLFVSCDGCDATYYFNPATIGFIRRDPPDQ
ncbi:toll/interleukin-1 receptor domain-containing protein [Natrarchaeobius chitinivorans]|uniref:Toll/interleukin-1 receptor domain-containing protein n=1 Tax=Natrarchaeobius chitinivorans TaxID=1679083 RepID=A0A3N6M3U7_NATCH|nr:toll/interleukin-1 receptor domain-containing protein [Natrarchaeobius chitinivorans]RQG90580.1 toll/interleukin-1 receptor domain-containing protein [Natrarchaeobius chitinivorans]